MKNSKYGGSLTRNQEDQRDFWHAEGPQQKNEIMSSAATLLQLETIILSELRQEEKTKYHMFSLLSGS